MVRKKSQATTKFEFYDELDPYLKDLPSSSGVPGAVDTLPSQELGSHLQAPSPTPPSPPPEERPSKKQRKPSFEQETLALMRESVAQTGELVGSFGVLTAAVAPLLVNLAQQQGQQQGQQQQQQPQQNHPPWQPQETGLPE